MIILLIGVACVGATAIGGVLARDLGFRFFDLGPEVERFYGKSLTRLNDQTPTEYEWRLKCAPVLKKLLQENRDKDTVIALTPGGLMDAYLRVMKKSDAVVVSLHDTPENILKRITFYDDDSKPLTRILTDAHKKYYLAEIKKDITYYKRSHSRAHFRLEMAGLDVVQAAEALRELLGLEKPVNKADTLPAPAVLKAPAKGPIVYTNRKREEYYLYVERTKKGAASYHFSAEPEGEAATEMPEGYEIYEDPNARVFLVKSRPKLITDEEVRIIDRALRKYTSRNDYRLDVGEKTVTIFESDQRDLTSDDFEPFFTKARMRRFLDDNAYFTPVFRFVLTDEEKRLFIAEVFSLQGSEKEWTPLREAGAKPLKALTTKYVPYLGKDFLFVPA